MRKSENGLCEMETFKEPRAAAQGRMLQREEKRPLCCPRLMRVTLGFFLFFFLFYVVRRLHSSQCVAEREAD